MLGAVAVLAMAALGSDLGHLQGKARWAVWIAAAISFAFQGTVQMFLPVNGELDSAISERAVEVRADKITLKQIPLKAIHFAWVPEKERERSRLSTVTEKAYRLTSAPAWLTMTATDFGCFRVPSPDQQDFAQETHDRLEEPAQNCWRTRRKTTAVGV